MSILTSEVGTLPVHDSFIVNALRNSGYNNYSAIEDIVDNSIEPEVGSTEVKVYIIGDHGIKATTEGIIIADDGAGMCMDTLKEAMCLGSQTGKTKTGNLGAYGAGLKTAALSIGMQLDVYTRSEVNGAINHACLDIEKASNNEAPISLTFDTRSDDDQDYISACLVCNIDRQTRTTGTIVIIRKLDRLTCSNRKNFGDNIRKRLGMCYNKYISNAVVSIEVEAKPVVAVNPMLNSIGQTNLLESGDTAIGGVSIHYNAYYLPIEPDSNDNAIDTASDMDSNHETARNMRNQGFYIYRQNRLVGKAVSLGVWTKHPSLNGFRVELFVDGTADYLFGSTFNKMVTEKRSDYISQALMDKLTSTFGLLKKEAIRLQQSHEEHVMDADTEKMYQSVVDKQNGNLMLRINRKGVNNPPSTATEHEHRGPQLHPALFRERKNKWLDGFRENGIGRNEMMYVIDHVDGKRIITINTDHPFYKEFYSKLPLNMKFKMAQIMSCDELAKEGVNYYGSDTNASLVDQYLSFKDTEIGKSLSN